jgi:hypothetical protein
VYLIILRGMWWEPRRGRGLLVAGCCAASSVGVAGLNAWLIKGLFFDSDHFVIQL